MGGILLIAITTLVVILVMMLLWKPKSAKEKVDRENEDLVYCEAYEMPSESSNSGSIPQVGLVWNRAYNKCTMLESESTTELEIRNQTETVELESENELAAKVLYEEVSDIMGSFNDYEEVY